ncbi:hypothetical protein [Cryobacterium sp. Y57]|nr:hypothetical protein [Cryobacterium sp. Y57]
MHRLIDWAHGRSFVLKTDAPRSTLVQARHHGLARWEIYSAT